MIVAYFRGDLHDLWHGIPGEQADAALVAHTSRNSSDLDSELDSTRSHVHEGADGLVLDDSIMHTHDGETVFDTEMAGVETQESDSVGASLIKPSAHHSAYPSL